MASSSGCNNAGDDDQDKDFRVAKGKEEVFEDMSEDDGEEVEEDQCQYPYATIAQIGVSNNPFVLEKREWLQPADKGLRKNSTGRSPFSRTRNPFHTFIHNHQLENIPLGELPSAWDIDRTHTGSGSFWPNTKDR